MRDDLVSAIETLQDRIRVHNITLRKNETQTRVALIDPLLRALGWDVSDPALVTPEYPIDAGRADYVLLDANRRAFGLVEAKQLGGSLKNARKQMLDNAIKSGVSFAGVTDGNHWELYKVSAQERICLLQVSIAKMLAHECALKLWLHWPRDPVPAPVIPPPCSKGWITLSCYNYDAKAERPIAIRFPGGVNRQVPTWPHLATRAAAWLWSTRRLTRDNVPVAASRPARYIINYNPVHQRERQFTVPMPVARTPFFYEAAYDEQGSILPPQVVDDTKKLLEHCDVNLADVYVHK
ncbi:MAG: hypothetical protein OXE87_07785 [Chloroflexi bacterium]|nr:hypothetical protein [Chloroflexota bacterium]